MCGRSWRGDSCSCIMDTGLRVDHDAGVGRWTLGVLLATAVGCTGSREVAESPSSAPASVERREAARARIRVDDALESGLVDVLTERGQAVLAAGVDTPRVRLAMAIGAYYDGITMFTPELVAITDQLQEHKVEHVRGRRALVELEAALAQTEAHLAEAAKAPDFTIELCPSCWVVDWDGLSGVDERDLKRLEIERDDTGRVLPDDDPRRKPTIRFDHGDVMFGRAYVAMQRALLDLLLAYDWSELDGLYAEPAAEMFTLRIEAPERMGQARSRILEAIDFADAARRAYLAETDDDKEWLPSPTQQNRATWSRLDAEDYEAWAQLTAELRALVEGREGLSVTELAQIGDDTWDDPPQGFIDVGRLLSEPGPIEVNLARLYTLDTSLRVPIERLLKGLFGDAYREAMQPSPLVARLGRFEAGNSAGAFAYVFYAGYVVWFL